MRKIIVISLAVLLVVGAFFFVFKKSPTITNYPSRGTTIIAFGDSLVEGVGATMGNDFVSLLSQKIGEPIINMGISGNTSADGIARAEGVIAQNPKVVLVLFGGNDFLRKVPIEETFKNIDAIVVELQRSGAVVVLLGVRGGVLSDQYDDYFEDIAANRGALYVPNVLAGLISHPQFMYDGIHPNDAGYAKIAEKIYPVLRQAL
jgi:lysophospholipase L1-like esterase